MYAVISVPFFDTEENNRALCTIKCLQHLSDTIQPPHVVVPVDNGSEDKAAADFASSVFDNVLLFDEPMSIAGGVNCGWHLFHDDLVSGKAIAIKHDSDLTTWPADGGWVDEFIRLFAEDPNVYLAGPLCGPHKYTGDWKQKDHGWWFETKFIYGGVQARSPKCFKAIGYSRQPHGRWGYGDHWDTWRVQYLGKKLGVIRSYRFKPEFGRSALPSKYKQDNLGKARAALGKMKSAVTNGNRPVCEEFHDT